MEDLARPLGHSGTVAWRPGGDTASAERDHAILDDETSAAMPFTSPSGGDTRARGWYVILRSTGGARPPAPAGSHGVSRQPSITAPPRFDSSSPLQHAQAVHTGGRLHKRPTLASCQRAAATRRWTISRENPSGRRMWCAIAIRMQEWVLSGDIGYMSSKAGGPPTDQVSEPCCGMWDRYLQFTVYSLQFYNWPYPVAELRTALTRPRCKISGGSGPARRHAEWRVLGHAGRPEVNLHRG